MPDDRLRHAWNGAQALTDELGELLAEHDRFVDGHQVGERIRHVMDETGADYDRLADALTALFWDMWTSLRRQAGVRYEAARHARDDKTEVMEAVK